MSQLPVFVESIPGGFRATTVGPADLVADGATADAAVRELRTKVDAKLAAGGQVASIQLDDDEFDALVRRIAANPLTEQIHQVIRDARKAADDADSDHPL